jgi:hypothetical protein
MKCIIAGSRTITDYDEVKKAFDECPFKSDITEIVSGAAKGVDTLGEKLAFERDIKLSRFPADWNLYKKRAGVIRNQQMGDYADCAIVVMPEGGSTGSLHMLNYMKKLDKPTHVRYVKEN